MHFCRGQGCGPGGDTSGGSQRSVAEQTPHPCRPCLGARHFGAATWLVQRAASRADRPATCAVPAACAVCDVIDANAAAPPALAPPSLPSCCSCCLAAMRVASCGVLPLVHAWAALTQAMHSAVHLCQATGTLSLAQRCVWAALLCCAVLCCGRGRSVVSCCVVKCCWWVAVHVQLLPCLRRYQCIAWTSLCFVMISGHSAV